MLFYNILKILGMKYKIPTQLIKEKTLDFRVDEDKVTVAWNIAVALYYKARGLPWKFSVFEDDVCYVGISFYRDFQEHSVILNTSMAQIVLSTGESYILRGESFEYDRYQYDDRKPHLDEFRARKMIDTVLDHYQIIRGNYPRRIVLYKTSNYIDEEINGFYKNKGKIVDIDMITINQKNPFRLYRAHSKYSVIRGTLVKNKDQKSGFLFTFGHIPVLETLPGMRIANPIEIRQFTENSSLELISKEILKLSRLDWNSIKYCQKLPVTLAFSGRLKDILAERRTEESVIKTQYMFYM